MKHTIISWDCSFRNFFHLIDAVEKQNYNKSEYELVFVEQRTREIADAYNHQFGLKSLWDRYQEVRDNFNFRVIYLNHPLAEPYHLGRSNNVGLEIANGEIISIMDGDILIHPNFLKCLDVAHYEHNAVINLARHYASRPVRARFDNWTEGVIDFDLCLAECPDTDKPIPRAVNNKGPLISAPREWWFAVGGYDKHRIWATGISRLGQDVTTRLEIYSGRESLALPGQFCVHPYHPAGFDRGADLEKMVLSIQEELIIWSRQNREYSHRKRQYIQERLYKKYQWVFNANISGDFTILTHIKLKLQKVLSRMRIRSA